MHDHAADLVAGLKKIGNFEISVAGYPEKHPESATLAADIENLKAKVDAGANGAITQYFYNTDAYFRFVDDARALGIEVPIVPGIMPISNFSQLKRFSEACGAEIPRWIRKRLEDFGEDMVSLRAFGLEVTTDLCRKLLDGGAPGLHFYTMNQSQATLAVWNNLGLPADKSERADR